MIVNAPGQPPGIICEQVQDFANRKSILYAHRNGHRILIGEIRDADLMRMPFDWRTGQVAIEIDWSGVVSALDALSLSPVPQPQ